MSKFFVAALLAVLTYSLTGCGQAMLTAPQSSSQSLKGSNVVRSNAQEPQEILVKFKSALNASSIRTFHAQHGLRTLRVIPGVNVHVMTANGSRSMAQVLAQVSQDPMVEYAEPNRAVTLSGATAR